MSLIHLGHPVDNHTGAWGQGKGNGAGNLKSLFLNMFFGQSVVLSSHFNMLTRSFRVWSKAPPPEAHLCGPLLNILIHKLFGLLFRNVLRGRAYFQKCDWNHLWHCFIISLQFVILFEFWKKIQISIIPNLNLRIDIMKY